MEPDEYGIFTLNMSYGYAAELVHIAFVKGSGPQTHFLFRGIELKACYKPPTGKIIFKWNSLKCEIQWDGMNG